MPILLRNWPKRYTLLVLCFFAVFVCYIDRVNISVAVIAMQETFGWSETTKGFVLSSFFIGYMLFQIPSGYLANHFGGKLLLGVAVAWWSVFTMLTPVSATWSFLVLIAVRIAMGLGEAAMFPGAYNLFTHWIPPTERSRAVSVLVSGIPIGTVFALVVTGWIISRYGWPFVFYFFGGVGLVWVAFWLAKAYARPDIHPTLAAEERLLLMDVGKHRPLTAPAPWLTLFKTPAVLALIVNHFCSNWALYMLLAWLPSYFRKIQRIGIESVGLYSAVPWLIMFIMINVAAWIADSMVKRKIALIIVRKSMQLIALLGSAAFLILACASALETVSLVALCGALGCLAFAWSGYGPNHLDIAPDYADVLVGITNTAGTLPGIVGVMVTGWLVDLTGNYNSAFLLAALINVLGAVVWVCFAQARPVVE
jgi:ACS family sodium-dependent inorganic phosphate cotransporter